MTPKGKGFEVKISCPSRLKSTQRTPSRTELAPHTIMASTIPFSHGLHYLQRPSKGPFIEISHLCAFRLKNCYNCAQRVQNQKRFFSTKKDLFPQIEKTSKMQERKILEEKYPFLKSLIFLYAALKSLKSFIHNNITTQL